MAGAVQFAEYRMRWPRLLRLFIIVKYHKLAWMYIYIIVCSRACLGITLAYPQYGVGSVWLK